MARSDLICIVLVIVGLCRGATIPKEELEVPEGIENIFGGVGQDDPAYWQQIYSVTAPSYIQKFVRRFGVGELRDDLGLLDISTNCIAHTLEWLYRLNHTETLGDSAWALHMVDSWGKLPEGILHGHINAFGDYDECVDLRANEIEFLLPVNQIQDLSKSFSGRYCTVALSPVGIGRTDTDDGNSTHLTPRNGGVTPEELIEAINIKEGILVYPSLATCLPSSCSDADAIAMLRLFAATAKLPVNGALVGECFTDQKPDFDAGFWSMIGILAVFLVLTVAGTGLELVMGMTKSKDERKPGLGIQMLLAFSLINNIRKWQNTKSSGGENFGCIHGLRFLSMMWVILSHTWVMISYVPFWNSVDVKKAHEVWSVLTIINGTLSVDTFFVMAGFLVAYNLLKIYQKSNGKLNIIMFYVHRYLRLTPTYAVLVGIMATIMPYVSSGPYWSIMDTWGQFCKDNWWTNLLYINNLYKTKELCQGEGWYLAVDFQLYILTPFIIYPLWKYRKGGSVFFVLITVLAVIAPGLQAQITDSFPTVLATRNMGTMWRDIYIKPWARAQTYVAGMWLGYLVFELRGKKSVKLSPLLVTAGWLISTTAALSTLYGIVPWFDPNTEIPDIPSFFYASFHRLAWGICICWIIFACVYGYGGYVNSFLSWAPFIPLGRLTFCTYLVSFHLQMIYHLTFRQPPYYSSYSMTAFFFNHVVISLLAGFICTMLFETPIMQLEKLLIPASSPPPRPKADEQTEKERNGIYYQTMEDILKSHKPVGDSNNNADV